MKPAVSQRFAEPVPPMARRPMDVNQEKTPAPAESPRQRWLRERLERTVPSPLEAALRASRKP